jgi:hypothetical protein
MNRGSPVPHQDQGSTQQVSEMAAAADVDEALSHTS